jgi:hypothetical protein
VSQRRGFQVGVDLFDDRVSAGSVGPRTHRLEAGMRNAGTATDRPGHPWSLRIIGFRLGIRRTRNRPGTWSGCFLAANAEPRYRRSRPLRPGRSSVSCSVEDGIGVLDGLSRITTDRHDHGPGRGPR